MLGGRGGGGALHEKSSLHCQRPYLTIPLTTFDATCQRPFLICVKCDTPLSRIKSDQMFCQISLARASKASLLIFDSRLTPVKVVSKPMLKVVQHL